MYFFGLLACFRSRLMKNHGVKMFYITLFIMCSLLQTGNMCLRAKKEAACCSSKLITLYIFFVFSEKWNIDRVLQCLWRMEEIWTRRETDLEHFLQRGIEFLRQNTSWNSLNSAVGTSYRALEFDSIIDTHYTSSSAQDTRRRRRSKKNSKFID